MNSPAHRIDDGKQRGIWSRRDLFTRLGRGGFGLLGLFSALGFICSAFPRVLFQSAARFKAGAPADYVLGEVNEKYKDSERVWIIREEEGFYALFAKCTTSAAPRAGYPRKTSSSALAMGADSIKTGQTLKVRRPGPWTGLELSLERTVDWWWTRQGSFA